MPIPWICYSPIEMSAETYDLVVRDYLGSMRRCEFDKVISRLLPIADSPDHTVESRSVAHYVVAELRLRHAAQSLPAALVHAQSARQLYPDNAELTLATYLVEGDALLALGETEAAIGTFREGMTYGAPQKTKSVRWPLIVRTLACLLDDHQEQIELLDEILSSGTVWSDNLVDAGSIKLGALYLGEGKTSSRGDQLLSEILANPAMTRIHYRERLQQGLKSYLLYDYELAVEQFTEVIESVRAHASGVEDIILLEAYQGRIDSLEAIAIDAPEPFDRSELLDRDRERVAKLAAAMHDCIDRVTHQPSSRRKSGWLRAPFERVLGKALAST
jgi:hypothetical protein